MSTQTIIPASRQDPLIVFYNGLFSHFNQLARSKPKEAVEEIEDYIATMAYDLQETSWVGSYFTPEAIQQAPESTRNRICYIAKRAAEVVGEIESSLEELSDSEREEMAAEAAALAMSEDSLSSTGETDDGWETVDDGSVEEEGERGPSTDEAVGQIFAQSRGGEDLAATGSADQDEMIKADSDQRIAEVSTEKEIGEPTAKQHMAAGVDGGDIIKAATCMEGDGIAQEEKHDGIAESKGVSAMKGGDEDRQDRQ